MPTSASARGITPNIKTPPETPCGKRKTATRLYIPLRQKCPQAQALGASHPISKPHLKYLAVFVKLLRSFTYRCVKNAHKRKRLGHFFLAVAVVCGFRRCVRFSWGWGFKVFQDLCPLVIRKNSFNVPGHLSENL